MTEFKRILEGDCSTMVVAEHLSQIGLFLWRKGIELLPFDQQNREAFDSLRQLWDFNALHGCFKDIWERGAKTGEILLYVKPLKDGLFKIRYYDATQFDYEQDDEGLTEVEIKGRDGKKLKLTRKAIGGSSHGFDRVPAVVIQNRPTQAGRGLGEFYGFEKIIERHDWLVDQLRGNLEYFGGPVFFSSRSVTELTEAGVVRRQSVSSQGGYGEVQATTDRIRAKRVIGGVEPGEQLGFATPDPITPETIKWVADYEDALRRSLGSVPDGGYSVNVAGDIDILSRYALAITTGELRAEQYITRGIVKAFEMALAFQGFPVSLRWRYRGSLYPDSAQTQLTKSIVSRNLLRLGVNLESSLQHIFPEKSGPEIIELLEGGFAHELLIGLSTVRKDFAEDTEIVEMLKTYLMESLNARRYEYPIGPTNAERGKWLA